MSFPQVYLYTNKYTGQEEKRKVPFRESDLASCELNTELYTYVHTYVSPRIKLVFTITQISTKSRIILFPPHPHVHIHMYLRVL